MKRPMSTMLLPAILLFATASAVLAEPQSVLEMRSLFAKAGDAFDNNHPAEAVASYVAVLSVGSHDASSEAKELMDKANAELTRIGTMLSIDPGDEWVGQDGKQLGGSTRNVGKTTGLNPSVYLYLNYGAGKTTLADFPIHFEFARNSGVLIQDVATNAYGQANTTISKLDSTGSEAIVKAFPFFTVRGYTFAFRSVSRDFSYLPPLNIARVVVLERSEFGVSENPQLLDAAIAELKSTGLQLTAWNGAIDTATVISSFQGDNDALRKLFGSAGNAAYMVFAISESGAAQQLVVGGVKRNIWLNSGSATVRIVRDDGTVVISLILPNVKGQGNDAQTTAANCFMQLRKNVVAEIRSRISDINAALKK
ncbi:MAG: hypothetical protein NT080_14395 [Spirochaetes bacterium]|nr:hypothetical protein [Spirochaetota bacterium]